jgi:hypothetical protein
VYFFLSVAVLQKECTCQVADLNSHTQTHTYTHSHTHTHTYKHARTRTNTHTLILLDQVANLDSFDIDRTISLVPSEGEFALMNYRTSTGVMQKK